jgi:hypothetical protein
MAVLLEIQVFWDIMLCHLTSSSQFSKALWSFGTSGTAHTTQPHIPHDLNLHLQEINTSQQKDTMAENEKNILAFQKSMKDSQ